MFSMVENKFMALIAKLVNYRGVGKSSNWPELDYCTNANPATGQPNTIDNLSDF